MPAQVIIVERPRRGRFAIPRALPDWARAIWVTIFRNPAFDTGIVRAGSVASDPMEAPLFPRLLSDAKGDHRCVGCHLCVRVCPSRCLALDTEGDGEALSVVRFELASWACIGCGLCGEACPEAAIELAGAVQVELAPLSDGHAVTDLLTGRSSIQLASRG